LKTNSTTGIRKGQKSVKYYLNGNPFEFVDMQVSCLLESVTYFKVGQYTIFFYLVIFLPTLKVGNNLLIELFEKTGPFFA